MSEKDLILCTQFKLDLLGFQNFQNAKPKIHYFLIISLRNRVELFTRQNFSIKIVLCEVNLLKMSISGTHADVKSHNKLPRLKIK